jgi:8-oxo-dGTP diphosphatase
MCSNTTLQGAIMPHPENATKSFIGVGAIFIKNGDVLTVFRNNTEQNNNKHGLIGGLAQPGEPIKQAAIREIFEEVGVTVKPEDLTLVHVISSKDNDRETEENYFLVKKWEGEPFNKASHKHDRLEWVDMDQLPETLIARNRQAIENMFEEVMYSEYPSEK